MWIKTHRCLVCIKARFITNHKIKARFIKKSGEILDKLKTGDINATIVSTFSTLYTNLPHNLIKDNLIDIIERTFQREGSSYLACNDRIAFLLLKNLKTYHAWSCQNVCDALTFLLGNIFI